MARVTSPTTRSLRSTSSKTGNALCSVRSSALRSTLSRSCCLNAITGPRLVSASFSASPIFMATVLGCGSCSRKGTPLATMSLSSRLAPTSAPAVARDTTQARMMGASTSKLAVASMMITVTAAVMRVNPESIAALPMSAYVPFGAAFGLTSSATLPNRRPSAAPMSMLGMNTPAGNAPPKVRDAARKKYTRNANTTVGENSSSLYMSSRANRCFTTPSSFCSISVAISLKSPSAHVYCTNVRGTYTADERRPRRKRRLAKDVSTSSSSGKTPTSSEKKPIRRRPLYALPYSCLISGAGRHENSAGSATCAVATSAAPSTASNHAPARLKYHARTRFVKRRARRAIRVIHARFVTRCESSSSSFPSRVARTFPPLVFLRIAPDASAASVKSAEKAPARTASRTTSGRSEGDQPVEESGSEMTSEE
mmetsp:Transcript_3605/g.14556  ORF Transcript_3605/g.14556 Transcript_3605/m.14556 type:complete len:425 (+) Transcript_3605:374-1648(+)